MAELHDPLVGQPSLPQLRNLLVRDAGGMLVDLQCKFNNRPEPFIPNCLRSFHHEPFHLALAGLQTVVQNSAESGRAIRAAIGFGYGNSYMLDLIHAELAHLPKDLGCAQLRFEELRKIHLHVEVVGTEPSICVTQSKMSRTTGSSTFSGLTSFTRATIFRPLNSQTEKFC